MTTKEKLMQDYPANKQCPYQCLGWSRHVTDFIGLPESLRVGDYIADKTAFVMKYGIPKNQIKPEDWKPGMHLITTDSKVYGHSQIVGEIHGDSVTIYESNYKMPCIVTYDRIMKKDSPKVIGLIPAKFKNKYQGDNEMSKKFYRLDTGAIFIELATSPGQLWGLAISDWNVAQPLCDLPKSQADFLIPTESQVANAKVMEIIIKDK